MTLPHVQVMSRRECCLCEDAKEIVAAQAESGLCTWEVIDVDRDKALLVRYGMDVPVLLIDGRQAFMHRVAADELRSALLSGSVRTG
ncbi:MAG TPA: glutaredoxin family protein [Mariprofundaceae bacterium]|nr:glutaredoxin family protein [Mariprofundaceae bacterium]